jgi:NfeD-like C-terminal, partner-binding
MAYSLFLSLTKFLSISRASTSRERKEIASMYNRWEESAVVTTIIRPGQRGRVCFQSTTWFAICPHHAVLPADTPVRVVEHYNATTLIVEPVLALVPYTSHLVDAA